MDSLSGEVVPLALSAFTGALIQELGWWYEIRHDLSAAKYKSLLHSPGYWIIVMLMVAASTIGPLIFHWGKLSSYGTGDFLIFGAAFPLIFKQLAGNAGRQVRKKQLGMSDDLWIYLVRQG
jgi:hypothetical protein